MIVIKKRMDGSKMKFLVFFIDGSNDYRLFEKEHDVWVFIEERLEEEGETEFDGGGIA